MKPVHRRFAQILAATSVLAALGFVAVGCQRESPTTEQETRMSAEQIAFEADQQVWRDQRRSSLLASDGWTTLVGLHWIDPGAHYVGSSAGNGIRLTIGPPHLGMIELRDGQFRFVPEPGGDQTIDAQPVSNASVLRSDEDPAGPSVIGFDADRGQATVIRRAGRYALRVRHEDAPTRVGFTGVAYWPADRDWLVSGQFIAHPAGQTMQVANIIGAFDDMANPGTVEFQRAGQTYRLEAIDDGSGGLFLVFADRTNGHGSYGAGRFLDAPMPNADGRVVLDFNRAYNPPCAFTSFATCPLPPPENRLDLAVDAGEKNYIHPQ